MPPGQRDPGWEAEFLTQAAEAMRVNTGPAFAQAVAAGLELGARTYGDTAYLDRDNYAELLDEARDQAAYALMEYQRLDADLATRRIDDVCAAEIRQHLGQVVMLAAQIDYWTRLAQRTHREAVG